MQNNKNMRYIVITATGFQMDDSTGSAAIYHSAIEAQKHMAPGDQIVPVTGEAEVIEFQTGRKRLPSLNRHGRGT